jgi:hypothetical protein
MIENFQLSKHFSFYEMTTTEVLPLLELNRTKGMEYLPELEYLCENFAEPVRSIVGAPVVILSAFRCKKLNRKIGGSKTSQHKKAEAFDFTVPNKNMKNIWGKLRLSFKSFGQLIWYPENNFIHISRPRLNKPNKMIMKYENGKYTVIDGGIS